MIVVNVKKATEELKQGFRKLSRTEIRRATVLAINDTARTGRTEIANLIIRTYDMQGFTASGVKSRIILKPANMNQPWAKILISAQKIQLSKFRPRQVETGVSVSIMRGKRVVVKRAFMVKARGGKIVAARTDTPGGYTGDGFSFRTKRTKPSNENDLKIANMVGLSIPQAFTGNGGEIFRSVAEKLEEKYPSRLAHYLNQIALGNIPNGRAK